MKLPAYPRYKPSGVEWLGDVPEHWSPKRFGYLFRFYSGGTPSTSEIELWDGELPWVSSKDMKSMVISDTVDHISEEAVRQSSTCKLPAGSLLMVNRSGILRHSIPAAVITREMAINQDIRGCVPSSEVDSKFVVYLIEGNQPALLALWRQQGATVESLTFESVKTTNLHLPDPPEQRSIAAFLDRETGRVDRLVAKKRELIERLKEKRTALISRTVTRGLPAEAAAKAGLPTNPPLKPSALDWLDDIPKHWRVMRFRRLITRLDQGWSPNANNYPAATDELGVLKLGAASKGKFYPEDNKALDDIPEGVIPITPASGDLLVSRANTPDFVGDACVVKGNYPNRIIPDLLYRLRLRADTNGDFVCWFLLSGLGRAQIECDARGSSGSMVKLGQGHVRAWSLPFPPLPEQAAIAAYLDLETAKLDALVGKVEEAIERLQEYRTALITAAVTGKIDVRKHVT